MPRSRQAYEHPLPSPRPLIVRILSSATLVLPPLFYLIAFALSVTVLFTPEYAQVDLFDTSGAPVETSFSASPFYNCTRPPPPPPPPPSNSTTNDTAPQTGPFTPSCTRFTHFLGPKGAAACRQHYATQPAHPWTGHAQCQQVVLSASLYVAATTMLSLGVALATIYAAILLPAAYAPRENHPDADLLAGAAPSRAVSPRQQTPPPGFVYAALRPPTASEKLQRMHASSPVDERVASPQAVGGVGIEDDDEEAGRRTSRTCLWALVGNVATVLAMLAAVSLVVAQVVGVAALVVGQSAVDAGREIAQGDVRLVLGKWYMGAAAYEDSAAAWVLTGIGVIVATSRFGMART
ncbi:uncharacterized protein IWZ02DRAFT_273442 [Phyllosticta citriasiana]|uniref:Uncharacterized protein n=1 Tax=Phyllosticta citriasiana TaxID=595635 RepID=A0ABR1KZ83_9PEZI